MILFRERWVNSLGDGEFLCSCLKRKKERYIDRQIYSQKSKYVGRCLKWDFIWASYSQKSKYVGKCFKWVFMNNETQESKFHMKILEMTLGFCTLNGP